MSTVTFGCDASGESTVTEVAVCDTMTALAGPNSTISMSLPLPRLTPLTVTVVPPVTLPIAGTTEVIEGAAMSLTASNNEMMGVYLLSM